MDGQQNSRSVDFIKNVRKNRYYTIAMIGLF